MPQIIEPITSLAVRYLELRIEWLEKGLKEIANGRDDMNPLYVKQQAQSILDGEPTTADEHNKDFIQYRDIGDEMNWNRNREERIDKESK